MTHDFDAVALKETTRQQWQNAALAWYRWMPTLHAWLGPVTEAMLDLAKLKAGDRVVDLGAGAGEPSLSAAEESARPATSWPRTSRPTFSSSPRRPRGSGA